MTGLNVARVAKLIALLGFFLPWVLVSCAGQPVGRLSGVDLATGLTVLDAGNAGLASQPVHPNLWVTLSLAAVIGGMVASFLAKGRRALIAMATAAIVALVASAVGVSSISAEVRAQSKPPQSKPMLAPVGSVALQYGYFVTVAGLLVTLGACGMALAAGGATEPKGAPRARL